MFFISTNTLGSKTKISLIHTEALGLKAALALRVSQLEEWTQFVTGSGTLGAYCAEASG